MRYVLGALILVGLSHAAVANPAVAPTFSTLPDGFPQAYRDATNVVGEALASYSLADELAPPQSAVYDISAHVVVMPDGSRLEAHSGLGEWVDNPRFVRQHMRGATPPAVYDLRPRERLFHGIAALRLIPVYGDVFGRSGLLTHTYMLHGRPESNGCVVFRDYAEFLRGYRGGRVRRLRVVPAVGDAATRVNTASID